ncbi:23S rRNA (adenine(2503)-C(2))-methyltransferase RlmN [Planctomycetota bacterium]|nr:23S rRNA (adenine(2503)-C(2))-methyltransferase RlmN [Planctomycetota bacterium]
MSNTQHFFDLDDLQLTQAVTSLGMPKFRAKQLLDWVYSKGVIDPDKMTNLSAKDRDLIKSNFTFLLGKAIHHQLATDGTQKLLIDWALDHATQSSSLDVLNNQGGPESQTECVMIPATSETGSNRKTACISSQVGCPVGCKFCASGIGGLDANLTAGQIVQQIWQLAQLPNVGRITNVVFMGMGEPLSNYNAVTQALKLINASWGLAIGARKITVSTVGLPAQIKRLATIELPITLAISLHAPNDQIRQQLIPWAEYVTIEQLKEAANFYFDQTGREVTLEYILLGQLNDQPEHARELAQIARSLRCNINLIRYNEVQGMPYNRPQSSDVLAFQTILQNAGINTHIRASRGRDIAAACGQLRHEHSK